MKAIDPQNLHFTLFFFGEVDDKTVEQIKNKMNEITFQGFEIIYKTIGVFPSYKFPKVIWIGLDDNSTKKFNSLFELVKLKWNKLDLDLTNNLNPI